MRLPVKQMVITSDETVNPYVVGHMFPVVFGGKKAPSWVFASLKYFGDELGEAVLSFMTFPESGMGIKRNNRLVGGAPEIDRHDVKHARIVLKLAKF